MDPDDRQPGGVDNHASEPSYLQLARVLAQQIVSRQLAPGGKMPQERELSSRHKVSRFTVRNALDVLEAQGLIQRIRGKGTFVTGATGEGRWFSTAQTIQFVFVGATPYAPEPTDGYYGGIFTGARRMARTLGLQLKVESVRSYVRIRLDEYRPPKPSEVGGVIVCGAFDEQYIRMFGSEGVPVVVTDLWTHELHADSVVVDVESDAYAAVDHLAERGHTRLAFLAVGRQERGSEVYMYDPDILRLLDNLRRATQRRRIEMRDEWVLMMSSRRSPVQQAVRDLLALHDRPTALFCFDATPVPAALKAIEDAGLRCPEDISIVTRGSEVVAGRRMTSLLSDPEMMGRLAVKLLVERMQGQRQRAVRVAVVTRLLQGETTGPAPQVVR